MKRKGQSTKFDCDYSLLHSFPSQTVPYCPLLRAVICCHSVISHQSRSIAEFVDKSDR